MAGRPDDLASARLILTEQRKLGADFDAAWAAMLAALPPIERYPKDREAIERDRTLAALGQTEADWRGAYLREATGRRCALAPMGA
jgi:hypothetical protein